MPSRALRRGASLVGYASAGVAPLYVDSDDNILKMVPAGSGSTEVQIVDASSSQTLTGKTLTAPTITSPTINAPVGLEAVETVATTNVILAAESGSTYFLNLAVGFASTLPAVATSAGVKLTFIVKLAPTGGAGYTIVAAGAPDQHIIGTVHSSTGGDADSSAGVGDPATTFTFVNDAAVQGDRVDFICDGAFWYAQAFVNADTGATFTG